MGGADLAQVIDNWGIGSPTWEDGDVWHTVNEASGSDGFINQGDYDEVLAKWGTSYPLEPGEPSDVPEPATLALMLLGGLALLGKRS